MGQTKKRERKKQRKKEEEKEKDILPGLQFAENPLLLPSVPRRRLNEETSTRMSCRSRARRVSLM